MSLSWISAKVLILLLINDFYSKVDHYGIRDKTLGRIRTWLTNRKQRVEVDGDKSEESSVTSGVPQGTVLDPLMFLLHINDIGDNVSKGTYIKLFCR